MYIGSQIAQYIGEMCRYILGSEKQPGEDVHKLRVIFGNGLKQQIWEDFVARFHLSLIHISEPTRPY